MKNPYTHIDTLVAKIGRDANEQLMKSLQGNSLEYFKLKYLYGISQKTVLSLLSMSEKESIPHDVINKHVERLLKTPEALFGLSETVCQKFVNDLLDIVHYERDEQKRVQQEKAEKLRLAKEEEEKRRIQLEAQKKLEEMRNREYEELKRINQEEKKKKAEEARRNKERNKAKKEARDKRAASKRRIAKTVAKYNSVLEANKNDDAKVHTSFLQKKGLGAYSQCSSFNTLDKLVEEAERKYLLTSELLVHIYYLLKDNVSVKRYFLNNVLDKYVKEKVLTKRRGTETGYDKELLSLYNGDKPSAFDIMKEKTFILNWNDVVFSMGYFTINPPRTGNIKFVPLKVQSSLSNPSLNYLRDFFKERIPDVECEASQNKLTIKSEIELDKAIRFIAEASRQGVLKEKRIEQSSDLQPKKEERKRPDFYLRNFEDARRLADRLTVEELRKYKSRYVNWLAEKQMKNYKVIPCNERYCHLHDDITEFAFIFTIKSSQYSRVILALENLNTDRATLLFSVREQRYEAALKQIHAFLQGPEINKRSNLRERDFYVKTVGIVDFAYVEHRSSYKYSWTEMMNRFIRNL